MSNGVCHQLVDVSSRLNLNLRYYTSSLLQAVKGQYHAFKRRICGQSVAAVQAARVVFA
jgi:hypothetical protein